MSVGGTEMDKPTVKLIGEDGNVFNVIGRTSTALKRAGQLEQAREFQAKAFEAKSYDAVLCLVMEYCRVE